jgi:hypothetical protein
MTTLVEPETENRFPACAAMKLHLETEVVNASDISPPDPFALPSLPAASNGKSPYPSLQMSLTINFSGEQEIAIPGARVLGIPSGIATFGVRRCELRFTLVKCRLPLDEVALTAPLKRLVTVETQRERATETQVGATVGGSVGEKPSGTGSGTFGFKGSGKTVEKVTTERFQIHHSGDEGSPTWIFEVKDGSPILQGSLTRETLGIVSVDSDIESKEKVVQGDVSTLMEQEGKTLWNERPSAPTPVVNPSAALEGKNSALSACLAVRAEDIRLTWGKFGWTPNITRNRLALIERAIALKHIGPQLAGGLSTTRWYYG